MLFTLHKRIRLRGLKTCLFCVPTSLLALLLCFLLAYNGLSIFYLNLPLLAKFPPQQQPTNISSPPSISRDNITTNTPKKLVSSSSNSVMFVVKEDNSPQFQNPKEPKKKKKQIKRTKMRKSIVISSDKRFSSRIEEFFEKDNNCTEPRFFMTWISSLDTFGDREFFSVESLFRSHPSSCLAIVSETMDSERGRREILKPFTDAGFRVVAVSPDYDFIFENTPAEAWLDGLRRGLVVPGKIPLGQNLSNLLRLGLLYRYGGVYTDTDVVFVRSFAGLRNAVGSQMSDPKTGKWIRLNNAVLVFDRAHPVVLEFISEFTRGFDGSKWGHQGPYLVSRVVEKLGPNPTGLTVLPTSAFYPVIWLDVAGLFRGPGRDEPKRVLDERLRSILADGYAVHLWNHESKGLRIESGSVVDSMRKAFCLLCSNYKQNNGSFSV